MQWVEINGVSLRYELGGAGAETVLLIHELGGALESWDDALPAFQTHFRTLRYDQRGFGLSEKVSGTLALADMVADIVGLLDHAGATGRCHVVGSAMGAGIAAAFAARHPARVARLVVQSLVTHTSPDMRAQNLERAAEIERRGMRPFAKASADRSFPEVLRGTGERFERHCRRWVCNDPRGYAAIQRMLADMTLADELRNITCPTLSIGCVHDPLRPPAMVSELTKKIPNARYVEAESGHFMHVQSPELFCKLAVPFLSGA